MNTDGIVRFLVIGDVHIAERHLPLSKEAMNNCINEALKVKDSIQFIVVMGDVFDRHDNVKLRHINYAGIWLQKLAQIKPTIVLIGNHDRVDNKDFCSRIHPLMNLRITTEEKAEKGTLIFVTKPYILNIKGKKILFVPYVQPGRFMEAIDMNIKEIDILKKKGRTVPDITNVKDYDLIFAHQEFYGVFCGPIASTIGDKWEDDYPMVISGHIHNRHRFKDNIFYTGSLYPITMSESADKGVLCMSYNVNTKQLDYKVTSVVTTLKNIIHIDATDDEKIREMLILDRKYTKYVVKGTYEEIAAIKERVKQQGKNMDDFSWNARPVEMTENQRKLIKLPYLDILKSNLTNNDAKKLFEELMSDL